ncbi:MAG TPA: calcium-binding protein, partial [Thermoanaerobaculia bacterium]|nr:calcium-binding protein [Thermoanaerobaculia bacterium]
SGHDADDRIVYDTSTGNLWYDADGNGSGAAQLFATLEGAPTLAATDFSVVNGTSSSGTITGTAGNDSLTGTSGNDSMAGLGGNDTLVGLAGDDTLDGGAGTDSLNGGDGNDTYIVTVGDVISDSSGIDTIQTDVSFNLPAAIENATMTGTGSIEVDGNTLANRITGNAGNNVVWANSGNDTILGGAGNDDLHGEAGNDWLEGGAGNDTLGGGGDQDHLVFREFGAANADTVISFATNWDDLQLDHAAFTQIGATGQFTAGDARFYAASGASGGHDADDRLVFNTSTGQLYYDDDGSGGDAAQLVATLTGGATLAASDISVI